MRCRSESAERYRSPVRDTIAVAYATGTDRSVVEAVQDGTVTSLWRETADPDTVPSVVWSSGKLLVVYRREGELATAMIRR
jgi:hypothetical protein